MLLVTCCWLLVEKFVIFNILFSLWFIIKPGKMSSFRDLEINQIAFVLAKRVHIASLKLPTYELYEQGSQICHSSNSIKDQIAEGYGRRRYKPEFIKFLIYAQSSCDETTGQSEMIMELYPDFPDFNDLSTGYDNPGKKINSFIQYVETSWKT